MSKNFSQTELESNKQIHGSWSYSDIQIEQLPESSSDRISSIINNNTAIMVKVMHSESHKISQKHFPSLSTPTSHVPIVTPQPSTRLLQSIDYDLNDEPNENCTQNTDLLQVYSPLTPICDKEVQSYTIDNRVIKSDHSLDFPTYSSIPFVQDIHFDLTLNETFGSTPELPVSESSDSLDIPFASLLDITDFPDFLEGFSTPRAVVQQKCNSPPGKHSSNTNSSVMSPDISVFNAHASVSSRDSSTSYSVSRSALSTYEHQQPEATVSYSKTFHKHEFAFSEPSVVCALSETKCSEKSINHDLNIDNKFKPHLVVTDRCCQRYPQRSVKDAKTDKCFSMSQSLTDNSLSFSSSCLTEKHEISLLSPASADIFQGDNIRVPVKQTNTSQNTMNSDSAEKTNMLSARNVSWSYHALPDTTQNTFNCLTYCNEEHKLNNDVFITVRPKLPSTSYATLQDTRNGSAPKRRKGNDMITIPADTNQHSSPRPVRQRLSFKTPPKFKHADSTLTESDFTSLISVPSSDSARYQSKCGNHHSTFSFRSLTVQKENSSQSASDSTFCRQPFAEISNMSLDKTNASSTFSNKLIVSPRNHAKSKKTSHDVILPSREEELLSRDAYYCDFTVDRQHKIDGFISRKVVTSNVCEENKYQYTHQYLESSERFVRNVEGAEDSSYSFAFQAPSHSRVRNQATHVYMQQLRSHKDSTGVNKKLTCRSHVSHGKRKMEDRPSHVRKDHRKLTSQNSQCTSEHTRRGNSVSSNSHCPFDTRCSSALSRPRQVHESCTTHPKASSTMILDSSLDREVENFSTLSVDEGPYSRDESFHCNTIKEKKQQFKNSIKFYRRPISEGQESPKHLTAQVRNTFDISTMVSHIDCATNSSRVILGKQIGNVREVNTFVPRDRSDLTMEESRSTINETHANTLILAGANSFVKTADKALRNKNLQYSEINSGKSSNVCNSRANTSSMMFNRKSSIVCTSSEDSDNSNQNQFAYSHAHSKHTTVSIDMNCEKYKKYDMNGVCSVISDDLNATSKIMLDYPQSNSGESIVSRRLRPASRMSSKLANRPSHKLHLTESSPQSGRQDLLDSILTDSPQSVNFSGIFAPDNSYTVERVSSHDVNCRSSSCDTASTLVNTCFVSDSNIRTLPGCIIPLNSGQIDEKNLKTVFAAPPQSRIQSHSKKVKHVYPLTSNAKVSIRDASQDVTASTRTERPVSVRNNFLDRNSVFVMKPGVIIGPPKIKNKNSLVQKWKKFSSNFYKKTEKIKVIANL